MGFWIAVTLTLLAAAGALAFGARRGRAQTEGAADLALYRDQLRDVDRDRARGVLTAEEAERLRVEVSRRLLAADRAAAAGAQGSRGPATAALALSGLALAGAVLLYAWLGVPGYPDLPRAARLEAAAEAKRSRPPQAEMEAAQPAWTPPDGADAAYLDLMEKLRQAVAEHPGDRKGWELLARNEAQLGNFAAAWRAQEKVIGLAGTATAEDHAMQAALMVQAAGGMVSPEAESALTRALQLDPRNGTALFYAGLLWWQTGRPDRTFQLWAPLLAASRPSDPWAAPIRERMPVVAQLAGQNRYELPPLTGSAGPSEAEIAAAEGMAPAEREQMIRGMVDGLAARLAEAGGPAEDWARLIRALGVLGETERARAIWQEAQGAFAADPAGLEAIRAAAEAAGVAG